LIETTVKIYGYYENYNSIFKFLIAKKKKVINAGVEFYRNFSVNFLLKIGKISECFCEF